MMKNRGTYELKLQNLEPKRVDLYLKCSKDANLTFERTWHSVMTEMETETESETGSG